MTANMHITVAGKQVETGDALRTHVEHGLSTIAGKYFDHAMEAVAASVSGEPSPPTIHILPFHIIE